MHKTYLNATRLLAIGVAALATMGSTAHAAPAIRTTTGDTFVYAAAATAPFGTAPFTGVSRDRDNARTVWTLAQFDTTGLSLAAGESAKLRVYSKPGTGTPFANVTIQPSAANPAVVEVYRVTAPWSEASATWNNKPATDATPLASFTVDAISQYFSVDVTSLVSGWIASPATNFGLELRQRDVVSSGQFDVATIFDAKESGVPAQAATLVIPEPASLASLAAIATMAARRRRA